MGVYTSGLSFHCFHNITLYNDTYTLQVNEYQISGGILELAVSKNVLDIRIIQFLIQITIDLCQNDTN